MAVNVTCNFCSKQFFKTQSEIKKSKTGLHFCTKSCAASHNNKVFPKRKRQGICHACGDTKLSTRQIYCKDCLIIYKTNKKKYKKSICLCGEPCSGKLCWSCYKHKLTISQSLCLDCGRRVKKRTKRCKFCNTIFIQNNIRESTLADVTYEHLHSSSAYAKIRTQARSIANKLGWKKCVICGYDKHVEIDHIRSISSFDKDTKISIINDKSNLRPLCRNCHWEVHHLH